MNAFTHALREHMRINGVTHSYYGGESLGYHMRKGCAGWVIPEGARAVADVKYEFAGTFVDSMAKQVIDLDTPVSCACGEYQNRRICVEGTMQELLTELLAIPVPTEVEF